MLEKSFNITGSCISWLSSYLINRYSTVVLKNSVSKSSAVAFGVPQGSILGPLLFILYTSDLPRIIHSFSFNSQMYADDSYIYTSFPKSELSVVMNNLSSCLTSVMSWSNSLFLKLNPSKFELICFNKSDKSLTLPSLNISSDLSLEFSSSIRSLGFVFDSTLSLSPQIRTVAKSSYFHLRRIKKLMPFLDDATLKLLVTSLILSRIDYCNSLYYGLPFSTLYPLNKAFNSAARLVARAPLFSHISPFLLHLHWLPLKFRIIFKICTLMFKINNNISPKYLNDLIVKPKRAGLRSSSSNHFFIISVRHSFAKSAFAFSGPLLWNSLPSSLTSSESLTLFRKGLKKHLFERFIEERC